MFGLSNYENRKPQVLTPRPRDIFDSFFGDGFLPAALYNGFFQPLANSGFSTNFTADIKDLGTEYAIEAEMPGMAKEDIKLGLDGDVLTITAEKKEAADEDRCNYVRRERRYGTYSRSFRFEDIKADGINAKFEGGILRVTLPKLDTAAEHRKTIDIE